ncbi:MAG: SusD/RagB family nutrient-binding outer membrane lipoprotein [Paludibacteraceae bacterium]|nr:SusD/RagB family nutrient-binding outer membrane lipoprotein [Paludibacteraceae bacterium]
MNKLKYLFLVALLPLCVGCEDFLDINKDPDSSTSSTVDQMLPVVVFYTAQQNYDHAEYGVYLSQCLTTGGRSQTGAYAYKSGWDFPSMNRHPQWRRHFFDLGANLSELIKLAEKIESPNYILIARTIRLASTLITTDAFGEMPLSEVYKSVSPKYDSQEEIYQWMMTEADELIALYDNPEWTEKPTNKKITIKQDRIFGGDLVKWKHYTLAVKARLLLRKLPNWDNTPASCDAIIAAVDAALGAGWEEPRYYYPGGSGEKNCPWGNTRPIINGWESRANLLDQAVPSQYFMKEMLGLYDDDEPGFNDPKSVWKAEDPRLLAMMAMRSGPTGDETVKYRYLENNIGMGVSYKVTHYPDLYAETNPLTQNTGYVPLITEEELLLIKAEALYWKNDKAAALEVMKQAVDKSMERYDVDHLLPQYKGNPPTLYTYSGQYLRQIYMGTYTKAGDITQAGAAKTQRQNKNDKLLADGKYFPTADKLTIGHIMRQKYVCMYLQPEQWTDVRRYKYSNNINQIQYDGTIVYPKLRRPYNLYTPYWMTAEAIEKQQWVQRLNADPETEEKYNRPELERLGAYKNPEWLKKPMIWAN